MTDRQYISLLDQGRPWALPAISGIDLCPDCGSLVSYKHHAEHDELHDRVLRQWPRTNPCPECSGIGHVMKGTVWWPCDVCHGSGRRPPSGGDHGRPE